MISNVCVLVCGSCFFCVLHAEGHRGNSRLLLYCNALQSFVMLGFSNDFSETQLLCFTWKIQTDGFSVFICGWEFPCLGVEQWNLSFKLVVHVDVPRCMPQLSSQDSHNTLHLMRRWELLPHRWFLFLLPAVDYPSHSCLWRFSFRLRL